MIICLFLIWLGLTPPAIHGATSLLGVGSGGGGLGRGVSFMLDTEDKHHTRLKGQGIGIDVELLDIITSGGVFKFTNKGVEFVKGPAKWLTQYSEGKMTYRYHDQVVLEVDSFVDSGPVFSTPGIGRFHDVVLDKSSQKDSAMNLCVTEILLNAPVSSQDTSSSALIELERQQKRKGCEMKIKDVHSTVQEQLSLQSRIINLAATEIDNIKKNANTVEASVSPAVLQELEGKLDAFKDEVISNNRDFSIKASTFELKTTEYVTNLNLSVFGQLYESKEDILQLSESIKVLQPSLETQITEVRVEVEGKLNITHSEISQIIERFQSINETLEKLDSTISEAIKGDLDTRINATLTLVELLREDISLELSELEDKVHQNFSYVTEDQSFGLQRLNESFVLGIDNSFAASLVQIEMLKNETIENLRDLTLVVNSNAEALGLAVIGNMTAINASLIYHATAASAELLKLNESVAALIVAEAAMAREQEQSLHESIANVSSVLAGVRAQLSDSNSSLQASLTSLYEETYSNITLLGRNASSAVSESISVFGAAMDKLNSTFLQFKEEIMLNLTITSDALVLALSSLQDEVWTNSTLSENTASEALGEVNESLTTALYGAKDDLLTKIDELHVNTTAAMDSLNASISSRFLQLAEERRLAHEETGQLFAGQSLAMSLLKQATHDNTSALEEKLLNELANQAEVLRRDLDTAKISIDATAAAAHRNFTTAREEYFELHASLAAKLHMETGALNASLAVTEATIRSNAVELNETAAAMVLALQSESATNTSALQRSLDQLGDELQSLADVTQTNATIMVEELLAAIQTTNSSTYRHIEEAAVAINGSIAALDLSLQSSVEALNTSIAAETASRSADSSRLEAHIEQVKFLAQQLQVDASSNFSSVEAELLNHTITMETIRQSLFASLDLYAVNETEKDAVAQDKVQSSIHSLGTNFSVALDASYTILAASIEEIDANLFTNVSSLEESLENSRTKTDALFDETKTAMSTLETSLQDAVQGLKFDDARIHIKLTELGTEDASIRGELATVVSTLRTDTERSITQMTDTVSRQLSDLTMGNDIKFEFIKEKISDVQGKQTTTEGAVAALTAASERDATNIAALQDRATRLESQMDSHGSQLTNITGDVREAQLAIKQLSDNGAVVETQVRELRETRLPVAESTLSEHSKSISDLQSSILSATELVQMFSKLTEAKVEVFEGAVNGVKQDLTAMGETQRQGAAELARLGSQVDGVIKTSLSVAEAQRKDMLDRMRTQAEAAAATDLKVVDIQADVAKLQTKQESYDCLLQRVNTLEAGFEAFKKRVDEDFSGLSGRISVLEDASRTQAGKQAEASAIISTYEARLQRLEESQKQFASRDSAELTHKMLLELQTGLLQNAGEVLKVVSAALQTGGKEGQSLN